MKALHSICQQIWKTQWWPQAWKRSVFIPIPKKGNGKERSNYCTTTLVSHTSKVMLKILQVRLQQHMNLELPDVQAGFRKDRGTRDQIANNHWIMEKAREFQKNTYFGNWWSLTAGCGPRAVSPSAQHPPMAGRWEGGGGVGVQQTVFTEIIQPTTRKINNKAQVIPL